jgi:uracil-DNA glycosylase family 4
MKQDQWSVLSEQARACKKCDLGCEFQGSDPHVFGSGNLDARIVFVGDSPDTADLGNQCLSSASKPGRVYDKVLSSLGLNREQVYTCNALVCNIPKNEEAAPYQLIWCKDWLLKQLALIQPQLVVTFGRVAACALLPDFKITQDHGKELKSELGLSVFSLYHPAYIGAYSPPSKREDFKRDLYTLRRLITERGLR